MMRNAHVAVAAAVLSLGLSGAASAATITLEASGTGVVALTLGIEGLGPGVGVGGFDFDVSFDPAVLSFSAVSFGAELGGPIFSLQDASASGGVVDLSELSLLPSGVLAALQPDAFVLATILFDVLVSAETTTSFELTQSIVATGGGQPILFDPTEPLEFTTAIPEVSGAHVFAVGLLVVMAGQWLRSGGRLAPRRSS